MTQGRSKSLSHFSFFLLPNFTMIAFVNAVEVLRMANQLNGSRLYHWLIISPTGGPVKASNGLTIETTTSTAVNRTDIVFVCGGNEVQYETAPEHLVELRRFARTGAMLGSLCTGAYALAKAGLLTGYQCAVHWEYLSAQKEVFVDTRFLNELFVVDRDRVTCSGGVAPLDMMLRLITPRIGSTRVTEIADQFIMEHVRDHGVHQTMPLVARLGSINRTVFDAISVMENNIEEPLTCDSVADRTKISVRQLQRLFSESLGVSLRQYYLSLRLRRARQLLCQTDMSIMTVAVATGFRSACHFSKSYRDEFGVSPSEERQKQALWHARRDAAHRLKEDAPKMHSSVIRRDSPLTTKPA
jgi:AraC family transcriptional regulator, glycine betaine-responsive activator